MNKKYQIIIKLIPLTIMYFIFYKIFSSIGLGCGECFWNSYGKIISLILSIIFIICSSIITYKYSTQKNQNKIYLITLALGFILYLIIIITIMSNL